MSDQFEPPPNHKNGSNNNFDLRLQAFYMPTQNPQQMLNYSFQTGEEFALQFIQERTNSIPQFVAKSTNVNQTLSPIISPAGPKRQLSESMIFNKGNETEISGKKYFGLDELEKNTSKSVEGSSRMYQRTTSGYNFSKQNVIKFMCSFGGRFLPRPSDGAIRYVGGETYILQLRKDISWEELFQKTTRLLNRSHTVKYHLPGEEWNVLILVSCDEDVYHMMEECDVLQGSEEKPRLFLFSSLDDEEDNEIHSGNTDFEARFVAAVNAATNKGCTDVESGWSLSGNIEIGLRGSAGDLEQLIFDMDTDSTNPTNSYPGGSLAIPLMNTTDKKTFTGAVARRGRMPFGKHLATNQGYTGKYHGYGKVPMPSSVPSESMFNTVLAHVQKELRPLNEDNIQLNFKIKERFENDNLLRNGGINATCSNDNSLGSIGVSPLGSSKSKDDLASLSYLNSSGHDHFGSFPRSDNPIESLISVFDDGNLVEGGHAEPTILVKNPEINSKTSFDRKQMRLSSHDEINIDEITGEKNSILRQKTIERSDPKNSIKSKELSIKWHDDMAISNRELSKDGILAENFLISPPTKMDPKFIQNKSTLSGSGSSEGNMKEIRDSVQPGYHTPVVDYSNVSSWINEGSTIQNGYLSQEEIGGVKLPLSENEGFKAELEPNLPAVDPLGTDFDLSNVQVIRNEDLEDLRVLGSGAFGTVYHGKWRGTDVAIKRIKNSYFTYQSSDKLLEEFWREAAILSKLHHPNVLAFYGVVKDGPSGSLATVTEFMVSGSLKRVLAHHKDRYLDQRKRIMLAMDAAIGMEYLHAKNVVHFDLKCDNLLVNLKYLSRPICKVADFGLSKMKETTMVSGGMRGTLPWMAPEQLDMRGNKVCEKIDVYSFGIVMWEILTSDEPYADMHYAQVLVGIMNNTLRPPVPSSCDPDWKRLMVQCWAADPDQRPSFTEIATHLRSMLETCQAKQTL